MKQAIEKVIEHLKKAQMYNDQLQAEKKQGSSEWHSHEGIDDQISEALALLGD